MRHYAAHQLQAFITMLPLSGWEHRIECITDFFLVKCAYIRIHFSLYSKQRRDVLLSAIGRLLLPALDFGIIYLLTSGLPCHSTHSQHFAGS